MEYVVFIALFILAIPLALFVILRLVIKDQTARSNVMNSDPLTRHYCFILNEELKKAEIDDVSFWAYPKSHKIAKIPLKRLKA